METEGRSLQAQLEWEEQILWDWEPDTNEIALEEYLKFGVYIVSATVILWKFVPFFWNAIQARAAVSAVALFLVIAVLVINAIRLGRNAGLFQRKFTMERYVITDRRLLVRDRKHPRWLSITYDKMEYLKVHATGLSIDGRVRNIDIIWLSDKDDGKKSVVNETRMSHVDGWETAVRIMYSRKFNVSIEEVDLTNKFVHVEPR